MPTSSHKPQRIAIVGAGAAGVAAAWSFSRHPGQYNVDVYEKTERCGGQATSEKLSVTKDDGKKVEFTINDGVQGGAPSYRNSIHLHEQVTQTPQKPVELTVSFGQGKHNWTNFLSAKENGQNIQNLESEVRRFEYVLKIISWLEPIFVVLPIQWTLKLFLFSDEFVNYMVLPLVALFFGTGNQTRYISSAILARVFLDPDLQIFEYDSKRLLAERAEMFAFDDLTPTYTKLQQLCEKQSDSSVKFHMETAVRQVVRHPKHFTLTAEKSTEEKTYDHVIFACDTTTIMKILRDKHHKHDLSFTESVALRNVQWYSDVTYTHTDAAYMKRHYEHLDSAAYFIHEHKDHPHLAEMSFNLTNYQPQLRSLKDKDHVEVYQTIYLDERKKKYWTLDDLDQSKVLLKKPWYQISHTARHFLFTVPMVRFTQALKPKGGSTLYAGSWTMFNTHEIAVISGLVAAHRLGAEYPFADDKLAKKQFDLYIALIHGVDSNEKKAIWQYALNVILWPILTLGYVLINVLHLF